MEISSFRMWVKLSSIWEERTPLKCRVFCKLNRLLRDSQASPHKPENCLELLVRSVRSFVVQWRHLMGNEGTKWGCKEMFSLIKRIHVIRLIYLFIYYLFVCWATLRQKPLYNLWEKCEGSCVVTLLLHFFSLYSPLKMGKHTLGNTGNSEARANTEQVLPDSADRKPLLFKRGNTRGRTGVQRADRPWTWTQSHLWPCNKLTQREWG